MDFYGIKENVEAIRLPEDAYGRICQNMKRRKEHTVMKKQYRKPLTIAAALVLCLTLPLGAAAAGRLGHFRDILGWNGAIVGTAYDNATDEIEVTAKAEGDNLLVTVRLLMPEKAPYREVEALALGSCYFTDEAGDRIAELSGTDALPLLGNTLTFQLGLIEDAHTLHIESFVGSKKAEQDLVISGDWEISLK